jgi:hypothetical protein
MKKNEIKNAVEFSLLTEHHDAIPLTKVSHRKNK